MSVTGRDRAQTGINPLLIQRRKETRNQRLRGTNSNVEFRCGRSKTQQSPFIAGGCKHRAKQAALSTAAATCVRRREKEEEEHEEEEKKEEEEIEEKERVGGGRGRGRGGRRMRKNRRREEKRGGRA